MPFYLGVDMGSSSIKATLLDGEGAVVMRLKRCASMLSPHEGFFEVDPVGVWWNGFLSICREVLTKFTADDIHALCVSSVCGSFVPVDAGLNPLYNAILYGIDVRSAEIVKTLNSAYGEELLRKKLGGAFTTHSILPKILWLKQNEPEVYRRTVHFVSSFNFVSARLTGVPSWDYPTAFGALMLDGETLDYPDWFCREQGIDRAKLPPVGCGIEVLGVVSEAAGAATGLKAGTLVMRGACDVNAEAMSVGAVRAGTAVAAFGSTVSLLLNTDRPAQVKGFVPGMSLLPGVWRIGAATSSGGRTVDWGRAVVDVPAPERPTGVFFLPYLDGARTPFNDPTASGAFLRLHSRHTAADMAGAVQEALGYELALLISMMEKAVPFPQTIEVSGGLVNIPGLMQLTADITGRALRLHTDSDASYGDALIAMTAEVPYDQLEDATAKTRPTSVTVTPSSAAGAYRQLCAEYIDTCISLFIRG